MSESPKTNPQPITVAAEPAPEQEKVVEQKQSFYAKTKHFVKAHKTPAIALGSLVALVGIAAVAGRKTEPLPTFDQPRELTDGSETAPEAVVQNETQNTVA